MHGERSVIYVYTCILGGFDNLRPPLVPPEPGVRFLCFTDCPVLPDVPPWEFRPVHRVLNHGAKFSATSMHDMARTSRLPKILPHLVLPAIADYSIWIDGNFQLRKPASDIINEELRTEDWAAHRHPARDCVYAEAEILLKEKIGHPAEVRRQIANLKAAEYPEHHGLWANGMLIRRHSEIVNRTNETWWMAFTAGCARDQISFPLARHVTGLKVNSMPHYPYVYSSPLMKFGWHAAWKDKEPNVEYRPERERIAARVNRLREIVGDGGYDWRMY
jgi:Protein of unknown function (DUF616)